MSRTVVDGALRWLGAGETLGAAPSEPTHAILTRADTPGGGPA
ncbi:hypothetical protein [Pseudonocardia sp.]